MVSFDAKADFDKPIKFSLLSYMCGCGILVRRRLSTSRVTPTYSTESLSSELSTGFLECLLLFLFCGFWVSAPQFNSGESKKSFDQLCLVFLFVINSRLSLVNSEILAPLVPRQNVIVSIFCILSIFTIITKI